MKIYEYFAETDTTISREPNDVEKAEILKREAEGIEAKEKEALRLAEAEAKKAAAIAKLEALGLDEDDLKALGL